MTTVFFLDYYREWITKKGFVEKKGRQFDGLLTGYIIGPIGLNKALLNRTSISLKAVTVPGWVNRSLHNFFWPLALWFRFDEPDLVVWTDNIFGFRHNVTFVRRQRLFLLARVFRNRAGGKVILTVLLAPNHSRHFHAALILNFNKQITVAKSTLRKPFLLR